MMNFYRERYNDITERISKDHSLEESMKVVKKNVHGMVRKGPYIGLPNHNRLVKLCEGCARGVWEIL